MSGDEEMEAARKREALRVAYRNVFGTDEGQMVLHDLIRRHGVFRSQYPGGINGIADGHAMAIQNAWYEGRRSVPLEILGVLQTTQNEAVRLLEEISNADGRNQRMETAISDDG